MLARTLDSLGSVATLRDRLRRAFAPLRESLVIALEDRGYRVTEDESDTLLVQSSDFARTLARVEVRTRLRCIGLIFGKWLGVRFPCHRLRLDRDSQVTRTSSP